MVSSGISRHRLFFLFALIWSASAALDLGFAHHAEGEDSKATEKAGPGATSSISGTSISAIAESRVPPAGTGTPAVHSTKLKIAFVNSMPPYEMAEEVGEEVDPYSPGARPGIQIDLVKAAFEGTGYTFTAVFQSHIRVILNLSVPHGCLDAGLILALNQPGIYYSNLLNAFHNVAVTRKSSGLVFKDFADMRGHTLAAWQGASIQLGSEFFNKLVKDNPNYYECPDQKAQYLMFVQHHVEVVILDKEIFKWWDQRNPKREPVVFHPVFKKDNNNYIGFRDPKVRDIFNAGLARIRQNGEWGRVFQKYIGVESSPPVPAAANPSP